MWIIILDVFGTVLIGGGIFLLVSEGEIMGRPAADLKAAAIGMLVVGGMMTVPLVVWAVKRAASARS